MKVVSFLENVGETIRTCFEKIERTPYYLENIGKTLEMYFNKIDERTPYYEEAYCKPCRERALANNTYSYLPCIGMANPVPGYASDLLTQNSITNSLSPIQRIICAKIERNEIEKKGNEMVNNYIEEQILLEA